MFPLACSTCWSKKTWRIHSAWGAARRSSHRMVGLMGWLVSSSDFDGDPEMFEQRLDGFMAEAEVRLPLAGGLRIGYIGVPPIFTDFYEVMETSGASVVFNEVQRQFAMPDAAADIYEQYARYTYPYDIFGRIDGLVPPFKGQVGFVPDNDVIDPAPVVRGEDLDKIGEFLKVVGRQGVQGILRLAALDGRVADRTRARRLQDARNFRLAQALRRRWLVFTRPR